MPLARSTPAMALALAAFSLAVPARAQPSCGEDGAWRVALTAGLGVGAGASGALISSGVITAADDTRDYEFYVGALVGIGVTTALSSIYAIYDGSTACEMANQSALGVVWSVPIVMLILGSALPIAVWGAADEVTDPMADMPAEQPAGWSWGVRF